MRGHLRNDVQYIDIYKHRGGCCLTSVGLAQACPNYDLSRVSVPIVMFTGGNDWIATPTSVGDLLPQIQHVVTFHKHIPHLDFLWGMDATTEVIVSDMNNKMYFRARLI